MRKRIACAIGISAACYVGLSAYVIAQQGIEDLLLCADKGGLRIPISKNLCRAYLFAFRGSRQDIEALHRGIGASFVAQGESSATEREQILRFLISKGLNVNNIDAHKLTPLHSAVLANSAEEVELLLRNGASVSVKDERFKLVPLDLAIKLQKEGRLQNDRQAVISLLRNAK
jgi:Ankyrin repeats (many copies)